MKVKLGQLVENDVGEWAVAVADSDSFRDRVKVVICGVEQYWDLDHVISVEDREIIKVLKEGKR